MEVMTKKQMELANKLMAAEKINVTTIHSFDGQKYFQLTGAEPTSRKLPDNFAGLEEWACNAVNLDTGSLCILYWLHDPASLCHCGEAECECERLPEHYNWDDIDGVWDTCEKWNPRSN